MYYAIQTRQTVGPGKLTARIPPVLHAFLSRSHRDVWAEGGAGRQALTAKEAAKLMRKQEERAGCSPSSVRHMRIG